ncbi:MAG: hypothetical protein M1835_005146 [Candelina submexicana]|nr:MAG: hypothetical protein M1835_005146 [Candelina submexicana]
MSIKGELLKEDHDYGDHKACHLFVPETPNGTSEPRSSKRRKLTKTAPGRTPSKSAGELTFQPLFGGKEKPELAQYRHETYKKLWTQRERCIESLLAGINAKIVDSAAKFVDHAVIEEYNGKLPTGLIVAGPDIASHGLLFEQIAARIRGECNGPAIIITAGEAPNLKTALKNITKKGTNRSHALDDEGDDKEYTLQKAARNPSYDLQNLHDHVQTHKVRKVVIAFQDSEAFDGSLLADLITLLSSWLNRIPFVLMFGIATSEEIFHDKLSRTAIRCMRGEMFDVEQIEECLEQVFNQALMGPETALWLGPKLSSMLLQRQRNDVQSIQAFVKSLKYAYMSHFYANPLSVFMADEIKFGLLQPEHFEALRNLSSFRSYAEELLHDRKFDLVRSLLDNDEVLFAALIRQVHLCRQKMLQLLDTIAVINSIRSCFGVRNHLSRSDLYIQAVAGELNGSVIVRDLSLLVRKASSDTITQVLDAAISHLTSTAPVVEELCKFKQELVELFDSSKRDRPLRSEHNIQNETIRTTVIAQKVELSKHKSSLSGQDVAYSRLVDRIHSTLESYFTETLSCPSDLFPHEILLYDHKSPYKEVFTPKPRHAIERSLSTPHDYLGCNCCIGEEGCLSSTQPTTAILYQLYLETGSLINVSDLWSAFYAIVGGEDGEECSEREAIALAELKYMGMVKYSRKKTDHLMKLAWKGL